MLPLLPAYKKLISADFFHLPTPPPTTTHDKILCPSNFHKVPLRGGVRRSDFQTFSDTQPRQNKTLAYNLRPNSLPLAAPYRCETFLKPAKNPFLPVSSLQ